MEIEYLNEEKYRFRIALSSIIDEKNVLLLNSNDIKLAVEQI